MGGSDEEDNLVKLTAREHFICHYLLAKMYKRETFEWYKMQFAFNMMKLDSYNQKRYFNSKLYEALRKDWSLTMSNFAKENFSGAGNSQFGTKWICNIELKQTKKIKKDDPIPEGWIKGRDKWKIKPILKITSICITCGTIFEGKRKYCTKKCRPTRVFSDETRDVMRKKKIGHTFNNGKNNPMYGTIYISNDDLMISKRIPKDTNIPENWYKGKKYKG